MIYVRRPNADYDYEAWWRAQFGCLWWANAGGGVGGVNGRFIYHRCHSPPGAEERPPKLKYSGVYSPD